ncbi:hypothetical protein [Desulfogranum marinum]|uniref:hypothetical protein n=1 Tax=Desulfogranum marinum TaxID=453220 RepID=UPI001965B295|nr:hypothetical protein [Desulfogranum marinum]MBM9514045.1 hypothetical protein [Desulfogranum marinum]
MYTNNRSLYLRMLYLLVLFVFFSSCTALAETSKKETKKEIEEAVAAIGEYSNAQKDAALAKAKELMASFDEQVEAWEGTMDEQWAAMKDSSREKYRESVKQLQQQRNELSEWYGSMKYSSDKAWHEVKEGFAATYENAVDAFNTSKEEAASAAGKAEE